MEISKYVDTRRYKKFIEEDSGRPKVSYPTHAHEINAQLEEDSFWFSHRKSYVLNLLRRFKIDFVADVGGGTGAMAKYLERNGVDVLMVEPDRVGVHVAKNRGVANVLFGRLQDIPFIPQSIPAIVSLDVLEHIKDQGKFLQSCHRILASGGLLVVSVPAYPKLWSNFDEDSGHFRRYTRKSLSRIMEQNGFKPLLAGYFFYLLPIMIFVVRRLMRKDYTNNPSTQRNRDHKKGILNSILIYLLKPEIWLITRGITMAFGSSCIMIAKKIPN